LARTNQELKDEKIKLQEKMSSMPTAEEITELNAFKAQIENSADAKLISEGKLDEVISRRVERMRLDFDTKSSGLTKQVETLTNEKDALTTKYDNFKIHEHIRNEAIKAKVLPGAIEDILSRSNGMFQIDADGSIVSRDSNGNIRTNEEGSPIDTTNFVNELKTTAPHYWPQSQGGGSVGSGSVDKLIETAGNGNVANYIANRRKQIKANK